MNESISPKVKAIYEAVRTLLETGQDIKEMKVADITKEAGIGKGTAYEYFDNKEELISSAILYHISSVCDMLRKKVEKMDSFSEIIEFGLDYLEQVMSENNCFIKFVHIFTDNSSISRLLQGEIRERKRSAYLPDELIEMVIRIGVEKGEVTDKIPYTYLSMTLVAKMLMYAVFLTENIQNEDCRNEEMRRLIYVSLIKELNGDYISPH